MARQMIGRLLCALAFLLTAFAGTGDAHAIEIKGKDRGTYDLWNSAESGVWGARGQVVFNYEVTWKIWTLMDAAVLDANIKWSFRDGASLPLPTPPGGGAPIRDLPTAAWKKVALYDVKLQLTGHRKGTGDGGYSVIIDLGVPANPGDDKWGFNVPESPEWDKLFKTHDGYYLSAEKAKKLLQDGFVVDSAQLVEPKMSFVPFFDALLSGRTDWRGDIMRRTVSEQIDNVEKLAGLPAGKLRARLAKAEIAANERPNQIPSDLQKLYDKLNTGVPDKYVAPARRGAYQRAREMAAEKGRREVKLLLPGQRADRYPGWKQAKIAELKARKPLPEEQKAPPPRREPIGPLFTIKKWDSKKKDYR